MSSLDRVRLANSTPPARALAGDVPQDHDLHAPSCGLRRSKAVIAALLGLSWGPRQAFGFPNPEISFQRPLKPLKLGCPHLPWLISSLC
jgi:hypothetical protein